MKNIESQFDTINQQQIGTQLTNLSIQILNIGVQILYSVMQMHFFDIDYTNLQEQIQNFDTQIKNIENEVQNNINMKTSQMNLQMNPINMQMNLLNNNNQPQFDNTPKKSFIFKARGKRYRLVCNHGVTVSELLKKFLDWIQKPELFKSPKLSFFFF